MNTSATPAETPPTAQTVGKNIIAVASGKGGVGKTSVSIGLCHALARDSGKTLLFDGDLGLANVDVQLGLTPARDLGAVIAGKVSMKLAVCNYEDGGFDILAGRSGSASLASLPGHRLSALKEELIQTAGGYQHAVIDLGAGVDKTVRTLAGAAARIAVVTTEEPTSLTDAYAFIKLAHAAGQADRIYVVVNQATSLSEGEKTFATLQKACQNFLKFDPNLGGIVRRDPKVPECVRHQTSLLTRYPTTTAAQDIEKLAAKLRS